MSFIFRDFSRCHPESMPRWMRLESYETKKKFPSGQRTYGSAKITSGVIEQIAKIRKTFEEDLELAKTNGRFDDLYLKYFSKSNGITTSLIKQLANLPEAEKKELGPAINSLQNEQKEALKKGRGEYKQNLTADPLIDLTLPQPPRTAGMLHPVTQIIRETNAFFRYRGYSVLEGPEIETPEYNFRKLNLPEGHPATDLQDTLFIDQNFLLRTHTSSVEARVLTEQEPPIRVAFPGKCFRNETPNAASGSFFYQYQGVVVDKGITIQNLMSALEEFHKYLFGDDVQIRFRYKYYPEVSPGLGTDILCTFCKGGGCDVCRHRGWMEVLGSGMIHHNILLMCGIDPEIYTGFAFGMGLDRLVMSKFNINAQGKLYDGSLIYL